MDIKAVLCTALLATTLSGCATHELLENNHQPATYTKTVKQTLINDQVLAFGKPATAINGVPANSVVIVGLKQSYVLTEGSDEFVSLLSGRLNPDFIKLTKPLDFFSKNNDGRFVGTIGIKYSRLKEDITKDDRNLFLKHNADECTNYNEEKMGVQSYCFDIKLAGMVYPAVSNQASMKRLSKYYPATIYTETTQTVNNPDVGKDAGKTLVLLPFAVAFDVVTLPFQAIYEIFD